VIFMWGWEKLSELLIVYFIGMRYIWKNIYEIDEGQIEKITTNQNESTQYIR
jgi:hypothetical protein